MVRYEWIQPATIEAITFTCGFCGARVGPNRGYLGNFAGGRNGRILICPNCTQPTFFATDDSQYPAVRMGRDVQGISDDGVRALYDEARDCTTVCAYTAAVLVCRKILMNLAAQHGAPAGQSFVSYIDFLGQKGYVPPNGRAWVDEIRQKGNEATHEIARMGPLDAKRLLTFVEMLLRFDFEFPTMVNPAP
jgi:hypothetical protein